MQLRQRIIDVCSANGGHIGASLGAVELAIALHSEFTTPKDSIVWDVGHQSYAHKILTDRAESFASLRRKNGISGFTSREESPHDVFGAGHSSTSISAALGIAEAKRIRKDASWTIAVIGDGGLTAGLAFEALNQAGASKEPRLLLVVNDNNLSISPNVGALNQWAFGTERQPKHFFESLGFNYIGPIDGHGISAMREEIAKIKSSDGLKRVSVLHVITTKGKGFSHAEADPVRFHGVGPFDKFTGKSEPKPTKPTYSKIFANELKRLASEDERIVAITAAMAEGTGLAAFEKEFPGRFYDVGIAEPHALVFAAGLATQKLKPFVAIYSTFLQRAVDSAIHDIALQNLDVTLCVDRAGLVGADGPTHHGLFDIAIFRAIPNVSIAAPASLQDLKLMLAQASAKPGLKVIRYPRAEAFDDGSFVESEWGKAKATSLAEAQKNKICIWAIGSAHQWAKEALSKLSRQTRQKITLVDARFAKPIDHAALRETLENASALITIEDGCVAGGFGSALIESAFANGIGLPKPVKTLGAPDRWVKHADINEQRDELGLSGEKIAALIEEISKQNA